MKKLKVLLLLFFTTLICHSQSNVLTFSGSGDLNMNLGRYRIGTAIEIITNVQGGWGELGGIYQIVCDWNSTPKVIYRGEIQRAQRLTFYAYQENSGYIYLFAKWDNQSPSESYGNNVTFTINCSGEYNLNSNGDINNATELKNVFVITSDSGNVGIGTATPLDKLDVYGKFVVNHDGIIDWGASRSYGRITWDNGRAIIGGQLNMGLALTSNNMERIRIDVSGNVGIGTTDPKNKLDVNGTIRAKEVKVETGWADFVFTPTYKLRPLSEVEQFIKTNGHLPEIPKAEEVQQYGVNLGEMQTKLLQKVEELTLYVIEQNKKIDYQEKLIHRLETELINAKLPTQSLK
jgi:hypothetical protein